MAGWAAFRAGAPELAALAEARLDADGLVLVGTVRANGWPRISPVEPLLLGDVLYLGMMWRSRKAVDLLRDPRCVVHSVTTDPSGAAGDMKLYGRAVPVDDPDRRERYADGLEARIGWHPTGEYHLFELDLTEVGYFAVVGEGHDVRTWRP